MANEQDKKYMEQMTRTFDKVAPVLNDLSAEFIKLQGNYGDRSQFTLKKKEQLDAFRALYDNALTYINYLRGINASMYIDFLSVEMIRQSRQHGLTCSQIANIAGLDPSKWKKIDRVETLIRDLRRDLNLPDDDEKMMEFEEFIKVIKSHEHAAGNHE